MKKTAITITVLTISLIAASTVEADAVLTGEIDAEVKEWLGIVYPEISLENQSVTFGVDVLTDGDKTTYRVNDTLIINLDVTKENNRTYIFPRSIFYSAFMTRKITDIKLLPIRGILSRIFPMLVLFKSVNIVKGMLGKADQSINISLNYEISNTTFENGEKLTMTLCIMGFMPGDLNGLSEKIPIITKKQITLEVSYIENI